MSTVINTRSPGGSRSFPTAGIRRTSTAAVLVGVAATMIAAALSWVPSVWYDEAATVVSATRPWADLAREVAALVAHERALEPAGQQDAVVYGPVERHPLATSRIIEETYPSAFVGMRDPLLQTPARRSAGLWETQRALTGAGAAVDRATVVWVLTAVSPDDRTTVARALAAAGYHPDGSWERTRTWILRYRR